MARKPPAGTPAVTRLVGAGIAHTLHAYEHDPRVANFGLEAADALGVEPSSVFKTLLAVVDGTLVVGVVPVTGKLDLKALARAVGGSKAAMAEPQAAQRATGYVVGGISPIGQKLDHRTVLDESAILHETIYVSGGRRGLDIGLAPDDLVMITRATYAAIAR